MKSPITIIQLNKKITFEEDKQNPDGLNFENAAKKATETPKSAQIFEEEWFEEVPSKAPKRKLSVIPAAKKLDKLRVEREESKLKARRSTNFALRQPWIASKDYYQTFEIQKRNTRRLRKHFQPNMFIIYPDDPFKDIWGLVIILLLIYSATIIPYRAAFVERDPIGWRIVDGIVDVTFLTDIILTFFTAFYDSDMDIIMDRGLIAKHYLTGWFCIDVFAIFPFDLCFQTQKDYNSLARIARLPRLYKLLKITRLLKALRNCNPSKATGLEFYFKNSQSAERLISFLLIFVLLCHVSACLFYLLAKIEGIHPDSWILRYNLQDSSNLEIYTTSMYWTITTITTVGYGDISAGSTGERWYAIVIMMVGVMSYSFAISAMSSMISSMDKREHDLKQNLDMLAKVDLTYDMTTGLYLETIKSITRKYKSPENLQDKQEWIDKLPRKLKVSLNKIIHHKTVSQIPSFQHQSSAFLEYISGFLSVRKYSQDQYIIREGEDANEVFFILKGQVEYVIPKFNDIPFIVLPKGQHFGELDMLIHQYNGKRHFAAKAKEDLEVLILTKTDLLRIADKFEESIIDIFRLLSERHLHISSEKNRIEERLRNKKKKISKLFVASTDPLTHRAVSPKIEGKNKSSFLEESFDSESFASYTENIDDVKQNHPNVRLSRMNVIKPSPIKVEKRSSVGKSNDSKEIKCGGTQRVGISEDLGTTSGKERGRTSAVGMDANIYIKSGFSKEAMNAPRMEICEESMISQISGRGLLVENMLHSVYDKQKYEEDLSRRTSNLSFKILSNFSPLEGNPNT